MIGGLLLLPYWFKAGCLLKMLVISLMQSEKDNVTQGEI